MNTTSRVTTANNAPKADMGMRLRDLVFAGAKLNNTPSNVAIISVKVGAINANSVTILQVTPAS
jgi:hypothetical protein